MKEIYRLISKEDLEWSVGRLLKTKNKILLKKLRILLFNFENCAFY